MKVNDDTSRILDKKWYQRYNMTLGIKGSLYSAIDNIAGDCVFGKNRGKTESGYNSVFNYMEKSENKEYFINVTPGKIIKTPPTHNELVLKLSEYVKRAKEYYKNNPHTAVIDQWAGGDIHDGSPLNKKNQHHSRVLQRSGKRFKGKIETMTEQMTELIISSTGMLSEGYVISFLNSGLRCPECKAVGAIGWCDAISHRSVDSFRDAICMSCREKGIITLFEIKTRWEEAIQKNKETGTYAGSFPAISALDNINANVYLVLVSRDTGDIRLGKITSSKLRGNKHWLYALQEGLEWGSPSSYVYCEKGLYLLPVKMPPLINNEKNIKLVIQQVLKSEQ